MTKANGWLVALLSFLLAGATSCSPSGRGQASGTKVVRIGYQKTGTLNLLRIRGSLEPDLKRKGISVVWIGFPAGPQLLEALNAESIDFGHAGDAPPILAQAAGVPFVYVAHEPPRPHAEAILVPEGSPVRSVADLRGRRVALNKGSNVHYLLASALENAGVRYDEVRTVFLPPSDARVAFAGGSVDAWAVWDPYFAEAELHGGAKVLKDGAALVSNPEYMLASKRLATDHPELIQAILQGLERESRWAREHLEEVAQTFADVLKLELATMRRVVQRKSFGILPMDQAAVTEQQRIADSFLTLGVIPRPLKISDAVFSIKLETPSGEEGSVARLP